MAYGFNGKFLRVDLSSSKISVEERRESFYRKYFGGRCVIAYYLLRELKPGIDPLSPENILIFAPGVITGAPIAGSGRSSVGAKSPLTGAYGEAEAGGFFGAELKRAGFDGIIIKGKAKHPVYLWVHDGEAEIRDARHLWGLDTGESQEIIRKELGDKLIRTAQIGKAGENMVRFACVIHDLRDAAGRVGMGAVMGSKNLKAIAVRGHRSVEVADPEKLRELSKWLLDNLDKTGTLHQFGTGAMMTSHVLSGNLPTRNFRDGEFPNPEGISAQRIAETVRIGMEGCFACPIRCKKVVKFEEPWSVDPIYGGPEYETLAALGSNCGIDDLKAICKAHELCQRYSLDTISTGATIAFAMECYENGLITKEDTGGIDLTFGNAEAMLKMIELIAMREGIGDVLAEGVKRAAEKIGKGAEKYAVHVKGEEVPMHDPRLKRGLSLGYAVFPTGADHNNNLHDTDVRSFPALGIFEEVPLEDLGPRKVRLFVYFTNWRVISNSLLMCNFLPWVTNPRQLTEIVRAVTGWDTSAFELYKLGERSMNLTRAFNVREGFTPKDDRLPPRFFKPQTSGPLSKTAVDPEKLEKAKELYYRMMGWNPDTGAPTMEKLAELDILWVADEVKTNVREDLD
ncbi:aldehyde ferredoxin oxidoreductase [Candidatus Bathyarchaeota archaeon]|nr:MAG: aldehyde ferredoxin oxidoreductase [Candidatus Bathyarchaeota archaeon]